MINSFCHCVCVVVVVIIFLREGIWATIYGTQVLLFLALCSGITTSSAPGDSM